MGNGVTIILGVFRLLIGSGMAYADLRIEKVICNITPLRLAYNELSGMSHGDDQGFTLVMSDFVEFDCWN